MISDSSNAVFRGIYRGGLVRLFETPPWPDGTEVQIECAKNLTDTSNLQIGLVIIAGFGLAGRWVADIFDRHRIDYVVIEQNIDTVKRRKLLGKKIILGDVSEEATLIAAGINHASILALTIPDEPAVLKATQVARKLNPNIYIVARTQYTSSGMEATQLGADAVVKAEQAVANRFYEVLMQKVRSPQTPS